MYHQILNVSFPPKEYSNSRKLSVFLLFGPFSSREIVYGRSIKEIRFSSIVYFLLLCAYWHGVMKGSSFMIKNIFWYIHRSCGLMDKASDFYRRNDIRKLRVRVPPRLIFWWNFSHFKKIIGVYCLICSW